MVEPIERSKREQPAARSTEIATVLVVAVILLIARFYSPADESSIVLCIFRKLTGLPCPGCGMTRSFCALAKGHLYQSFNFHPLGPVLFLAFIIAWMRAVWLLAADWTRAPFRWAEPLESISIRAEAITRRFHLAHLGLLVLLSVWIIRLLKLVGAS